jgi:hypothetical protein
MAAAPCEPISRISSDGNDAMAPQPAPFASGDGVVVFSAGLPRKDALAKVGGK